MTFGRRLGPCEILSHPWLLGSRQTGLWNFAEAHGAPIYGIAVLRQLDKDQYGAVQAGALWITKYRKAAAIRVPRHRTDRTSPVCDEHHFFRVACQLTTTAIGADPSVEVVLIRNRWPSGVRSQRCP